LQDRHVVLHQGGRADEEAGGIEEDAAAEARGRVDIGLEHLGRAALQVEGEILVAGMPRQWAGGVWMAWKPLK
jgi:hypothetical protein